MAITMAGQFGLRRVAIPTAGNAGGAMASSMAAHRHGSFRVHARRHASDQPVGVPAGHARTFLVNGLINDCGRIVREGAARMGWFDMSTLKEPYRIEGKKTMGLELAEQFSWDLPDVIVYPTGGGTGLIGMWKAFDELAELGWLRREHRPRMVAVQSTGCAPIVRAFEAGARFAEPFADAKTIASGIRVPVAVGDFMILDAVRASGGRAVAVDETRPRYWMPAAPRPRAFPSAPNRCPPRRRRAITAEQWIDREERGGVQYRASRRNTLRGHGGSPCPRSTRTRRWIGSESLSGELAGVRRGGVWCAIQATATHGRSLLTANGPYGRRYSAGRRLSSGRTATATAIETITTTPKTIAPAISVPDMRRP